jgi:hypothetical protein
MPLVVTYAVGVLACRWLVLGAFAVDTSVVVAIVAVPVVQGVAIAAWRRLRSGRRSR